jgi:hypothetical protein
MATVLSFYLHKVKKMPMGKAFAIGIPVGLLLDIVVAVNVVNLVKLLLK